MNERSHEFFDHTGFLCESNRHTRYSTRTVQSIVTDCACTAGIKKRVYPYLLRHSIPQANPVASKQVW